MKIQQAEEYFKKLEEKCLKDRNCIQLIGSTLTEKIA